MVNRFALLLACAAAATAQTYTISTVAGGYALAPSVSATSAQLNPSRVVVDSSGNTYISAGYRVLVVNSTGTVIQIVGTGVSGFSGDGGPAASAQLGYALGLAVDAGGNLFIADYGNNVIRKVSGGIITTVAGNGTAPRNYPVLDQSDYNGDGIPATSAALGKPSGVAVDASGNLFIADTVNQRIRKVSGGIITTAAGNGIAGYNGDNLAATSAGLNYPTGVAVDASGNLYIVDSNNNRIRMVSGGIITTVAGNGAAGYNGDNIAATSAACNPTDVAVDFSGNLFIADQGNQRIRKVSGGIITTVAGNGTAYYNGDNITAVGAELNNPSGVAVDGNGNLFIADTYNYRIRKVSGGIITTVAGNGEGYFYGDNVAASSAELGSPTSVAVDANGNLFIADSVNNRIREVSGGIITTVAGNGTPGYADNVAATGPVLNYPRGVAVDASGNLFIADGNNGRIRKVSGGIITTVAGGGTSNLDNIPATSAGLSPYGVAVDASGNLFIADYGNNRIREVSGGIITTVAGNGNAPVYVLGVFSPDYNGDNIPATSAALAHPSGIALDANGNLFIADSVNNRIRKVSAGIITTVAGDGTGPSGLGISIPNYNGDNILATSAALDNPSGIAVDASGNLFIADYYNQRIRKVSGGIITTVAGNSASGYNGDNIAATSATLNNPSGVAVDTSGNVFVADTANNRLRKLTPDVAVTVASVPSGLTLTVDGTPVTTPATFQWTPGTSHTLDASGPNGTQYVFQSWSQGGNASQTIVAPSSPTTYTASFTAIPPAAAVLSVTKTHTGSFTQGQTGVSYTVTVRNGASAGVTNGTVTVAENVPAGLTLISMSGSGWNCASNACTRADALIAGGSYPPITVTVNVAANAPSQVTNQVSISGGGSASAQASDATNVATTALGTPTIVLETPANGAAVSGMIAVEGFAFASSMGGGSITSVMVALDGTALGNAFYGVLRNDVGAQCPGSPECPNVGFGLMLNGNTFSAGSHTITVTAMASNTSGNTASAVAVATVNVSSSAAALYEIVNKNSGKVLDVQGASTANGAGIQQWDYVGGNNQKWQLVGVNTQYYEIVSVNSGKVLDVRSASTANGALIQQWDYLGAANQHWQLVPVDSSGNYEVVNKNSGRALDAQGVSVSNGALIQQWNYLGGNNQEWQLVPLSTQYYKIASASTGKVLDVRGVSAANGAGIQQWDYLGGDNQKWQLVAIDSTYYRIVNKNSGKVLDVTGVSTSNGAAIQQWDYLGGANQQWQIVAIDGTNYKIVNKNSGKVLDVTGVSAANGAGIQQWDYLGGLNQKWQLTPVQ